MTGSLNFQLPPPFATSSCLFVHLIHVRAFQVELEMLAFEERGKPEYPEKSLSELGRNQQQTQPTYDTGSGN